jgi:small conductance mechanosensitive channel
MLLLLRPYRVGDRVQVNGVDGVVHGLDLFTTKLHDFDNSVVFIPNSKALGETIVNFSTMETRRIVMDFGIDYDDNVDLALAVLIETAKVDPRIVADPAPWAKLTALGDNAVTVTLRAWTSPKGYVDTRFDLIKAVKAAFEREGISFPYPHQVAVLERAWTAPDRERQEASLGERGGEAASSALKADATRSSGSSSEAACPREP